MTNSRTISMRHASAPPAPSRIRAAVRSADWPKKCEPSTLATFENPVATLFAQIVSHTITSRVLRWSVRQHLLKNAGRLGLPRFEANLIIAIVQRQRESDPQPESRPTSLPRWMPWVAFLVVQGAILLAAWRVLG